MNLKISLLIALMFGQGLSGAGYASSSSHDMPYHAESSYDIASEAAANDISPEAPTPSVNSPSVNPPSVNPPSVNPPSVNPPSVNPPSVNRPSFNPPRKKPSYYAPTRYTPPRKKASYYAPASYTPPRDTASNYTPVTYTPPPPRPNPPRETPSYDAPACEPPPRYKPARANPPPPETHHDEAPPYEEPIHYSPAFSSEPSSYETASHVTASHDTDCHKHAFQFYAGMVGGIERMNGRRSEGLTETFAGNPVVTSYTSNFRMLNNNATLSFLAGFLGKLPQLPILIGPEFFLGRGNVRSTVTSADTFDPTGTNTRLYVTEFQRKFFYGGLIRIGYNFCRDYLISLSLGIDRSQFLTKRYFALDPTETPTIISRTKGFNGFLYGIGFEKTFKDFIVGIDFKLIQYRRQVTEDPITITNGPASSNFSVRPVIYSAGLRLCYRF